MRVLILAKYSQRGASSRLRSFQYVPFFQNLGFDVVVSSLFDDGYLGSLYGGGGRSVFSVLKLYLKRFFVLFGLFKYDIIFLEKEVFPYFPGFAERVIRLLGKPYIVDYDDAIFHNYDLSKNLLIRKLLGGKIDSVMRHSSCVIAGNSYLASRAKAAGARSVELVPTVVDHTRYIPRHDSLTERPVIGWIGSPSTQKYVIGIREVLAKACQVHGARLMLVGATPQMVAELPGLDVEVVPWSEDSEAELISRMDIGIMPLPDGPWEKGKCGYKLIQYMACAVPVIASPVGVNVDIVTGSHSGLLADSLAEWQDALLQLLSSAEQRREMGAAGREAVENTYSLQVQAPVLSRIFTAAINQSRA